MIEAQYRPVRSEAVPRQNVGTGSGVDAPETMGGSRDCHKFVGEDSWDTHVLEPGQDLVEVRNHPGVGELRLRVQASPLVDVIESPEFVFDGGELADPRCLHLQQIRNFGGSERDATEVSQYVMTGIVMSTAACARKRTDHAPSAVNPAS